MHLHDHVETAAGPCALWDRSGPLIAANDAFRAVTTADHLDALAARAPALAKLIHSASVGPLGALVAAPEVVTVDDTRLTVRVCEAGPDEVLVTADPSPQQRLRLRRPAPGAHTVDEEDDATARVQRVADAFFDTLLEVDADDKIVTIYDTQRFLGRGALGRRIGDLFAPNATTAVARARERDTRVDTVTSLRADPETWARFAAVRVPGSDLVAVKVTRTPAHTSCEPTLLLRTSESLGLGFWVSDASGRHRTVSGLLRMIIDSYSVGGQPSDNPAAEIRASLHPADLPIFDEMAARVLSSNGSPVQDSFMVRYRMAPDSEYRWVHGMAIVDPGMSIVVVCIDITSLLEARSNLRLALRVINDLPDSILVMSDTGTVRFMNRSARAFFGIGRDAPLVEPMISARLPERVRMQVIAAARDGTWRGDIDMVRADGLLRTTEHQVTRHLDSTTGEFAVSSVWRDVTDQRREELELREEKAAADNEARVLRAERIRLMDAAETHHWHLMYALHNDLPETIGGMRLRATAVREVSSDYVMGVADHLDSLRTRLLRNPWASPVELVGLDAAIDIVVAKARMTPTLRTVACEVACPGGLPGPALDLLYRSVEFLCEKATSDGATWMAVTVRADQDDVIVEVLDDVPADIPAPVDLCAHPRGEVGSLVPERVGRVGGSVWLSPRPLLSGRLMVVRVPLEALRNMTAIHILS